MSEARATLEEALEYLINEEDEKAVSAFHSFMVQKARAIHESLIEDDEMDEDLDESLEDELDEDNEAKDSEEVDEDIADARQEIRSDEYFGRDELTAEDDEMDDEEAEADLDAEMEVGDEEGEEDAEEEVTVDQDEVMDIAQQLQALSDKFAELVGDEDVEMDVDDEMPDEEMPDEEEGAEFEETKDSDAGYINKRHGSVAEPGQYSSRNPTDVYEDEDEDGDDDDLEEAVTHDPGVQQDHKVDPHGKHGNKDSVKHNEDAKLPESTEFDFDLTEEDFLDLEEGLKQVDVKMGGEQGGVKFAGEETQTKSPVAQKDKGDVKASPKTMPSKQKEHGTYDLEQAPTTGNLPHSGDNSHDSAAQTGSPKRSEVSKGGGLEKQKGYGEGEVGAGKFAGTEKQVKSPIGSQGTRTEV